MLVAKGKEWTFDTVVSTYEKMRPGYVDELYKMIFDYVTLDESSHAIEVGIGSGQATLPILKTGCHVTAVEYGANFSELCKKKFKDYPSFQVINDKFENVNLAETGYDFIYSATAFHWVPEEVGYAKVFSVLKHGGAFARFANHPYIAKDNSELAEEINHLYNRYYHTFYHTEPKKIQEYSEEQAKELSLIAVKYGFTDIQYALFTRIRPFTAKEYIELLGTYSDHIAVDEPIRKEFFEKIEEAIYRHGGKLNIYDTIDLQLARKL